MSDDPGSSPGQALTERARVAYETANALLGGGVSWEEQSEVYRDAWRAAIAAIVPPADDALHSEREAAAAEARRALKESVKLQSHYARILNDYDGGKRMTFGSADEWIARLRAIAAPQEARDE